MTVMKSGAIKPMPAESLLLSVLDTADDAIIIDQHARILVYNQACERLFGYTAAEALGQNVRLITIRVEDKAPGIRPEAIPGFV